MSLSNLLMRSHVRGVLRSASPLIINTCQGHTIRGKPPGVARSMEQRLQEENAQDPELTARVDIGFPRWRPPRSQQLKERLAHLKAQHSDKELEKKARSNELAIDLEEVQREYRKTTGQFDVRRIADHYGIFQDLFGSAYFVPRVVLDVKYRLGADTYSPVYNGNIIKPSEAALEPLVSFDGVSDPITGKPTKGDSFWTLIATNPDGHLHQSDAECLHWFVANIPNGEVAKGDVLVDYLPPFPPRGIGYQRFVFVLFKQNGKLDFSSLRLGKEKGANLEGRTFQMQDFYRQHQDAITPAGLCFYQTDWDKSLTKFYHDVLQMKEPSFEYDFPRPYLSDQKLFPLKQPFNLYMDKHRDVKQLNQEYLERKLAKTHPFEGPEPELRFPNAHPMDDTASWLKTEIRKHRLRRGRVQDY